MNPFHYEQEFANSLTRVVSEVEEIELETLLRKDLPLGGFAELEGIFKHVKDCVLDAKGLVLTQAPSTTIDKAFQKISRLHDLLREALNETEDGFTRNKRELYKEKLETLWRTELTPAIAELYPYHLRGSSLRSRMLDAMECVIKTDSAMIKVFERMQALEEMATKNSTEHSQMMADAKVKTRQIEDAIAQLGTSHYANRFENVAKIQGQSATKWALGLISCAASLLLCALFFGWAELQHPSTTSSAIITATTWRMSILFVISGATIVCLKSYSAARSLS